MPNEIPDRVELENIGIQGEWLVTKKDGKYMTHFFEDGDQQTYCSFSNRELLQDKHSLIEVKYCGHCCRILQQAIARGAPRPTPPTQSLHEYWGREGTGGMHRRQRAKGGKDPKNRARIREHYRQMRRREA